MTEFLTFVLCSRSNNTIDLNRLHFQKEQLSFKVIDNRGKSVAYGRQKGYEEADSCFISFIDDDDISRLTGDQVARMLLNYKKPVYTNSLKISNKERICLTNENIKSWSLINECKRKTKPHQTMILKKETALEFSNLTLRLLKFKKWPENTFDYVFRSLISLELGWDYFPEITYEWHIGGDSIHLRDRMFLYLASNYFFGYVILPNSPSYEKEKTLILNHR
jgi:hypothetical protein